MARVARCSSSGPADDGASASTPTRSPPRMRRRARASVLTRVPRRQARHSIPLVVVEGDQLVVGGTAGGAAIDHRVKALLGEQLPEEHGTSRGTSPPASVRNAPAASGRGGDRPRPLAPRRRPPRGCSWPSPSGPGPRAGRNCSRVSAWVIVSGCGPRSTAGRRGSSARAGRRSGSWCAGPLGHRPHLAPSLRHQRDDVVGLAQLEGAQHHPVRVDGHAPTPLALDAAVATVAALELAHGVEQVLAAEVRPARR